MKKGILIILITLLSLSCSDKAVEEASVVDDATPTEQVDTAQNKRSDAEVNPQQFIEKSFREKFYESGKQSKNSNSFPLFAYFLIFTNLVATAFAIIYAFQLNKRINTNDQRIDKRKSEKEQLDREVKELRQVVDQLKVQLRSQSSYQPTNLSQGRVSQVSQTQLQQHRETGKQSPKPVGQDKKTKPQEIKRPSKTIYLEANSDECFFQFYEQKRDTSKFVAQIIPGDMAATFEVIDVERIRSLNTSWSIKQAGNVAIKDAQGIKEQKPGKIHKTTDANGTEYWVIDEPVTVEFKK